jgi:bifunctional ADP-heptose synthase (sugar kinase/adenylyltransferase)
MNQQQRRSNVLLIGDSCYDVYYHGKVNRLSEEAPIPILDFEEKTVKEGMASNVYNNLISLGVKVDLITCIVSYKKRYIDKKSGHQLLRVDEKISFEKPSIDVDYSKYDAVMISDYDQGFLSYADIEYIIEESKSPVYIDTKKKNIARFKGATLKLNLKEWNSRTSEHNDCIITKGAEDIRYKGIVYKTPNVAVYDACGAGDTFFSAYVYSNDIDFAIKASSITVQHLGVYAPTLREIEECV